MVSAAQPFIVILYDPSEKREEFMHQPQLHAGKAGHQKRQVDS